MPAGHGYLVEGLLETVTRFLVRIFGGSNLFPGCLRRLLKVQRSAHPDAFYARLLLIFVDRCQVDRAEALNAGIKACASWCPVPRFGCALGQRSNTALRSCLIPQLFLSRPWRGLQITGDQTLFIQLATQPAGLLLPLRAAPILLAHLLDRRLRQPTRPNPGPST